MCYNANMEKVTNNLNTLNVSDFNTDEIVKMHIKIAFADITEFVEFSSASTQSDDVLRLKQPSEIDGTLVTEFSQYATGVRIKLADRQKSLEFLAKYFGLLPFDNKKSETYCDNSKAVLDALTKKTKGLRVPPQ